MPDSNDTPTAAAPVISLPKLAYILNDPTRWRILAQLTQGEALMVIELAERLGLKADSISKHLAALREAGIVELRRNRLYRLHPHFVTDKSNRLVDFGYCLLRLNTVE